MNITRLKLEHIRQFRDIDLSFRAATGMPRKWTVLLGDNATGKTTLLRSLAFGLCDESSAAGLVRERKVGFVRERTKEGVVYIELLDKAGRTWTIKTELTRLKLTGERVRQTVYDLPIDAIKANPKGVDPDKFPWKALFIAGYGAGRTPDGREEYESYRNIDAVYTLFQYEQPLQSPELAWRRLLAQARRNPRRGDSDTAEKAANQRIKDLLRHVLVLPEGEDISLEPNSIKVTGPGYSIPLTAHADGYKATTGWVLDLIAWRMLFNRGLNPKTMTGIVLLDEIEHHLHPRWQRYIVGRLREQFPRVQFIVTTHSPLCVAGCADLSPNECQLIGLARRGGSIGARVLPLPSGYRADQILTAEGYFDLTDTRNPATGDKVTKYLALFRKHSRDQREEAEFRKLRRFVLRNVPDMAQFEEERQVRDDLSKLINELRLRENGEAAV